MTLISKGRAINTLAISILVIVSEIVITSLALEVLLASYLFIGPTVGARGLLVEMDVMDTELRYK